VRGDRWRELDGQSHERDDGAAVRYLGLHSDGWAPGFGWVALGPDAATLADQHGRERRFRTAGAAKAAVDRAWP